MNARQREIVRIKEDIFYYKKYRQNLKKFTFELISKNPNLRFKFYKLLKEIEDITLILEFLENHIYITKKLD